MTTLADPVGTLAEAAETVQFCSFWIASRLFGVNILDVKEIGSDLAITPVFHAPASVRGYMNVRGQIHLVADIRRFFGFPPEPPGAASRVVLFKSSVDEPFGILVDRMDDVLTVDAQAVTDRRTRKEPPELRGKLDRRTQAGQMTSGVCQLDKGLLLVLNARGILQAVETDIETGKQ